MLEIYFIISGHRRAQWSTVHGKIGFILLKKRELMSQSAESALQEVVRDLIG